MMSRHLWIIAFEPINSLGVFAFVLAIEQCVQRGEHQMKSGGSRLKSVYSQVMISVHTSGEHLGSLSSVKVSCLASLQTADTLLVPQHMSQIRMGYFLYQVGWYCNFHAHLHVSAVHYYLMI